MLVEAVRPVVTANWLMNYEPGPLDNGSWCVMNDACFVPMGDTRSAFNIDTNVRFHLAGISISVMRRWPNEVLTGKELVT